MIFKNFYTFVKDSIENINTVYNISILDVSLKYRRTVLGNYWIILTYLITISIISVVWSTLLNAPLSEYFPRLFIGFTVFYLLISFTSSSTDILSGQYQGIILSLGVPINHVILRHLIFIILEYIPFIPVYFLVIYFAGLNISLSSLLFLPGLLLVFANGYWIIFLISLLCARFRDLGLFINAIMSASLLLTPVLWDKSRLGQYETLVYLNPFTSAIEAIRNPLLGIAVNPIVYCLLTLFLIIGFLISSTLYKHKKKLFNFWL